MDVVTVRVVVLIWVCFLLYASPILPFFGLNPSEYATEPVLCQKEKLKTEKSVYCPVKPGEVRTMTMKQTYPSSTNIPVAIATL